MLVLNLILGVDVIAPQALWADAYLSRRSVGKGWISVGKLGASPCAYLRALRITFAACPQFVHTLRRRRKSTLYPHGDRSYPAL